MPSKENQIAEIGIVDKGATRRPIKTLIFDISVRHDVHSHRHSRNRDRMPNLAGQPDEFVRGRNVRHARLRGNSQHTGE